MPDKDTTRSTLTASKEEVLEALEAAHAALMHAATVTALRYGVGYEHATQLAGAGMLIFEDWIPKIRREDVQ